eukprot:5473846-Pyramimonas_sp.AAC.1
MGPDRRRASRAPSGASSTSARTARTTHRAFASTRHVATEAPGARHSLNAVRETEESVRRQSLMNARSVVTCAT